MSNQAFTPLSNTCARTVTTASQVVPATPFSPVPSTAQKSVLGMIDYRFTVVGTQPVWVAYALEGAAAPTAAIPADGAVGTGFMIEGAVSYTMNFPYGTQFAVISAALGSTVYVTAGSGVAL